MMTYRLCSVKCTSKPYRGVRSFVFWRKRAKVEEKITLTLTLSSMLWGVRLSNQSNFRAMSWARLRQRGIGVHIQRNIVSAIISVLDPHGVDIRQIRILHRRQYRGTGPKYVWHCDSYDKLKPYRICINSCIDGYSRQIMWRNAYFTCSTRKKK